MPAMIYSTGTEEWHSTTDNPSLHTVLTSLWNITHFNHMNMTFYTEDLPPVSVRALEH